MHRHYRAAAQSKMVQGSSEEVRHSASRAVSLDHPTFMVWGANTDIGKTLVSAGLAAAAVRAQVRLYNFPA